MLTPERIVILLLIVIIVGIFVGYIAAFLGLSVILNVVLGIVLSYRYKKNTEMIQVTNEFAKYLQQYAENISHIQNLEMYMGDPDINKLAEDTLAAADACYDFSEYLNSVDSENDDEETDEEDAKEKEGDRKNQ